MSVASPELMSWLATMRQQVNRSNPEFAALDPTGWPIPFFGDIRTARVLTVGVNPSPTEFNPGTRWAAVTNESQWAHRLLNYFHLPGAPWHKWFLPWEASLRLLGCSYEDRTAAHLDLSPRATTVMGAAVRPDFCRLVAGDVHWLFESLAFAPCARLMLAAGGMIEPAPDAWLLIGSYLEQRAEHHGAQIERVAATPRLIANGGSVSLPLHSFSSGPAADDKFKLIKDVFAARTILMQHLE